MRWQRLGKIFDPRDHQLAEGCAEFAKSPQAVVFDDFVRVYFCAQRRTANGKYVSCPQYADFTKTFDRVIGVSPSPVIELGRVGEFDEHGIFPINVLRHEGKFLAYTSGWSRRDSVSIDMSIGLAFSEDGGQSFFKYGAGGPVMAAAYNEPFLVGDPFVIHSGECFHMWYIFGSQWKKPVPEANAERFYKIAHATSSDGVDWQRNGKELISTRIADECQALPAVFRIGELYQMVFCYRSAYGFRTNKACAYRLGYAISRDLENWSRNDEDFALDVPDCEWDSDMQCYPNAFLCGGETYLLYNGNEFGRYGFGLARLVAN